MDRNTQVLVKVPILKLTSACNFLLYKPKWPSIYTPIYQWTGTSNWPGKDWKCTEI